MTDRQITPSVSAVALGLACTLLLGACATTTSSTGRALNRGDTGSATAATPRWLNCCTTCAALPSGFSEAVPNTTQRPLLPPAAAISRL